MSKKRFNTPLTIEIRRHNSEPTTYSIYHPNGKTRCYNDIDEALAEVKKMMSPPALSRFYEKAKEMFPDQSETALKEIASLAEAYYHKFLRQ